MLLTRNYCLSRSRVAPSSACSTWSQASIFEPARSAGSPTSIVLQRATSGIDRVKPQQAGRQGQPSCAVPRAAKAHHATVVGEAEIYRAGRATRGQLVYDRPEKGLLAAGQMVALCWSMVAENVRDLRERQLLVSSRNEPGYRRALPLTGSLFAPRQFHQARTAPSRPRAGSQAAGIKPRCRSGPES